MAEEVRSEELGMSKAAPKHRAKREITRTVKPGAGGLAGSRDRVPCGV